VREAGCCGRAAFDVLIAVLDSRVNTGRYGQQVIVSLPRARRTRRIQDVREFFAKEWHT